MSGSLKDQLLALGFKPAPKPAPAPGAKGGSGGHGRQGAPGGASGQGAKAGGPKRAVGGGTPVGRTDGARGGGGEPPPTHDPAEIDLARAYALRAKAEREEKERLAREAAEKARLKAERKRRVAALLEGAALNRPDAEHPRHFEYGGKIRRVYVDEAQLAALNRGELGVVQHQGRFLVVTRALALEVHAIEPALLALLVDPDAPGSDDVPPDLVW